MERFEQLARALVKVAKANHYMIGIVEPVTQDEIDGAQHWLVSLQNKKPQLSRGYEILELALNLIERGLVKPTEMTHFMVVFSIRGVGEQFLCQADDPDHAIEQAKNAYPDLTKILLVRPALKSEIDAA